MRVEHQGRGDQRGEQPRKPRPHKSLLGSLRLYKRVCDFNEQFSTLIAWNSYVEELPAEVLGEVLKRHPNFSIRHSMAAGDSYFMTICECGGHYGDHYVHKRLLNLAFRAPDEITAQELPLAGTWVIPCAFSQSISVSELLDRIEIRTATS